MTGFTNLDALTQTQTPGSSSTPGWEDAAKRALDIAASALGLLALAPAFTLIAFVIRRDSPGPVFYQGWRLGKDDKPFLILKFRTMNETPESYNGPRVTAQDDERITSFGKWLRDSKINELPQLWNVLKGEMSLVGPRPEDPQLAEAWPPDVRAQVLSVRPGITSPASVLYRDEEEMLLSKTVMETYLGEILPSKLRLDQLYVHRRSLLLDLDVLLWTLLVLTPGLKHYKPPEESLFWGLLSRLGGRYVNWFVIDMLTTLTAFTVTGLAWRTFQPLEVGFFQAAFFAVVYSFIFSLAGAFSGSQRIVWRYASRRDALHLIPAILLAVLLASAVNYLLDLFPFGMILLAAALTFIGYTLARYRQRILAGILTGWLNVRDTRQNLRERVLIVGSGRAGQNAAKSFLNGNNARIFQVIGFVDAEMFNPGDRLQGLKVVGKRNEIPALVEHYDVGVIVYAMYEIPEDEDRAMMEICRKTRARIITWPNVTTPDEVQP